jgi:hypothetical protein
MSDGTRLRPRTVAGARALSTRPISWRAQPPPDQQRLDAVGVMNVAAMIGLAVVVLVEKTWRWGPIAGRVAGVAALALAVAVIWLSWLAPGLHAAPSMMMN